MIHIEMNIFEQGIPSWMIPDQYNIITHTETYKVIFLKIEEIPRLLENFLIDLLDIDPVLG